MRGQAQGFLIVLTQGIGMYLGAKIVPIFYTKSMEGENLLENWASFWWVPCGMAAAVLVFFVILFNDRVVPKSTK